MPSCKTASRMRSYLRARVVLARRRRRVSLPKRSTVNMPHAKSRVMRAKVVEKLPRAVRSTSSKSTALRIAVLMKSAKFSKLFAMLHRATATKYTSSTKSTCSRPRLLMPCSKRSKSHRHTSSLSSQQPIRTKSPSRS